MARKQWPSNGCLVVRGCDLGPHPHPQRVTLWDQAHDKKCQEEEMKRALFSFPNHRSPIDHKLEEASKSLEATICKIPLQPCQIGWEVEERKGQRRLRWVVDSVQKQMGHRKKKLVAL